MRLRNIILIVLLGFLPVMGSAQSIKTDFDKKVIMVDSLNLPPNIDVSSVLSLLPELLQRPGEFVISNYDIQIEGMSVGKSKDVAIMQLQIVDVQKIEVSESPVSSYNNNGQGGSINIVLRSSGSNGKPLWGSAGLSTSYPNDLAPQFTIGYKTPRFMIRGVMLGEMYNVSSDVSTITYGIDEVLGHNISTSDIRMRNQLARAYMEYKPTNKDVLKFNISEMYSYQREYKYGNYSPVYNFMSRTHSTSLQSMLNYQHTFGRSKLTAEVQHVYNPGKSENEEVSHADSNDYYSHQLAGKVELNSTLVDRPAQSGLDAKKLVMAFGVNLNALFKSEDILLMDYRFGGDNKKTISPENSTYYAMPYARFETTLGRLRMKLVGEFQHFKYDIIRDEKPFSKISNDITGKFVGEWFFNKNNNVRFILDRKLQRPTDQQLYPYSMFNMTSMQYTQGNPELTPMLSHEVSLDYITNILWGDRQSMVFNIGGSINHVSDIINSYITGGSSSGGGVIGMTQQYLTYENSGSSNILGANFMALYTHKTFSISLTSNLFHNHLIKGGADNHYTYYNIALYPHFNLKEGWHGGARLVYYSTINMKDNASTGNACVAYMSLGKAWKNFSVFAYQRVSLQKNSKDRSVVKDGSYTIKEYNMMPGSVGVGMKYTF